MGTLRRERRSLLLRATLLAAWVWSRAVWVRIALPGVMIGALTLLWEHPPRLTPPGAFHSATWHVVEDAGGIRLVAAPTPNSTEVHLQIVRDWTSAERFGAPVMVLDSHTVWAAAREDYVGPHGDMPRVYESSGEWPGSAATTRLRRTVAQLANRLQASDPMEARFLATPDEWRERLYWTGIAHLLLIGMRFLVGAALLTGLAIMPALWLGVGEWATRQALALRGHCIHCGYNLTGLQRKICPECGADDAVFAFEPGSALIPEVAASYERR